MRRPLLLLALGIATSLASWPRWRYGAVTWFYGSVVSQVPLPENGKVLGGTYVNDYFDLCYPLPEGWAEGLPGSDPSDTGYYLLGTLVPQSQPRATIMIAAQDMFFTSKFYANVAQMVGDFRQAMSKVNGMTIDRQPTEVKVADRLVYRVDFSGVGLYRATFTTESRCHVVGFNLTANDPELLADVAASVDKLSLADKRNSGPPPRIASRITRCRRTCCKELSPPRSVPNSYPFPVRIIVDAEGGVKHIHVMRATNEQRKSIEDTLRQWRFKPYRLNGRAVEIETGLVFRFTAVQNSPASAGDRECESDCAEMCLSRVAHSCFQSIIPGREKVSLTQVLSTIFGSMMLLVAGSVVISANEIIVDASPALIERPRQ
jgi:hypothetical protein